MVDFQAVVCEKIVININGRDVQRKNVCDMSSLWAPWQNGPYKDMSVKYFIHWLKCYYYTQNIDILFET